jgi:hypothetical protein
MQDVCTKALIKAKGIKTFVKKRYHPESIRSVEIPTPTDGWTSLISLPKLYKLPLVRAKKFDTLDVDR